MFTKDTAKYKASFITRCQSKAAERNIWNRKGKKSVFRMNRSSLSVFVSEVRGLLVKSGTDQEDKKASGLGRKKQVSPCAQEIAHNSLWSLCVHGCQTQDPHTTIKVSNRDLIVFVICRPQMMATAKAINHCKGLTAALKRQATN